jgi:hypothetical protein
VFRPGSVPARKAVNCAGYDNAHVTALMLQMRGLWHGFYDSAKVRNAVGRLWLTARKQYACPSDGQRSHWPVRRRAMTPTYTAGRSPSGRSLNAVRRLRRNCRRGSAFCTPTESSTWSTIMGVYAQLAADVDAGVGGDMGAGAAETRTRRARTRARTDFGTWIRGRPRVCLPAVIVRTCSQSRARAWCSVAAQRDRRGA